MDNSKKVVMESYSIDGGCIEKLSNEEKKDVLFDKVMAVGDDISDPKEMFSKCVDNEEEDVDCEILDGNPDKPVSIVNNGGGDSDDLWVVAEHGQVACRDYPHPRHLCVKFPFNSTPHESYCDKCHCYVCDSVAPCEHWGNGGCCIDHCHAFEKDAFWGALRQCAKVPGFPRRDKSQAYVYRYHRQKQSAGRSGTEFVPERGLTPANKVISLPNYNPLMHNEETPASGLYSATSVGSPYGAQISGCHPQRQSVDPAGTQLVPEGDSTLTNLQLWLSNNPLMHNEEPPASQFGFIPGTGTPFGAQEPGCHPGNNIGYELQRKKVGRADSQLIHEHVSSFKRPRTSGGASSNTGYHNSSSRNNYGYQFSADPMMSTKSDGVTANSVANTSPWSSMGIGIENYAPSGIRNANPVAPQIHTGSIFNSLAMTAPGIATQPRRERPFKNPVYWELEPLSPPSIYETVMPSIMEQEQEQKQKQKQNQKLP